MVREENLDDFLTATMPVGVFLNKHKSNSVPQWFWHTADQSVAAYWQQVVSAKEKLGGRLLYRSSNNAPLGLVDPTEKCDAAIAPRWYLNNVPPEWGEPEVSNWCTERGFVSPTSFRRQGRRAWFFRAHPSGDVGTTSVAFVFKSGISVAPARASAAKNYKAVTQAKTSWGAPEPKNPITAPEPILVDEGKD